MTLASTVTPLVNWARLQQVLASHDVDVLVATTNVNVTYLTDFWSLSQWSRRTAQVYGIVGRTGGRDVEVVLPHGAADLLAAPGRVAPTRVRMYGRFYCAGLEDAGLDAEERAFRDAFVEAPRHATPIEALIEAIRTRCEAGRIALEAGGLPDGAWEAVAQRMPRAEIIPAEVLLREVRTVKSPREVDLLRQAAVVTERAFADALREVRPGTTEIDLQRAFHRSLAERGGLPFLTSISAGRRTALPNGQATSYRIQSGDLVRFDGGCRFELYASDIARIAVMGQPTERQRDRYKAVVSGTEAAIAKVRAGITCGELFEAAVSEVRSGGIADYERSHCGHGIGIENYDPPHITPGSSETLEAGMVVCLETPYYELGWGGVQAEDVLLVTRSGHERFTFQPPDLIACG